MCCDHAPWRHGIYYHARVDPALLSLNLPFIPDDSQSAGKRPAPAPARLGNKPGLRPPAQLVGSRRSDPPRSSALLVSTVRSPAPTLRRAIGHSSRRLNSESATVVGKPNPDFQTGLTIRDAAPLFSPVLDPSTHRIVSSCGPGEMGLGQQPSPSAEQQPGEPSLLQRSTAESEQEMSPKRARARGPPSRLKEETFTGSDGEKSPPSAGPSRWDARRDPSPGSSSSSAASASRTQRSPISSTISSCMSTSSPASPSRISPTRHLHTPPASLGASSANPPPFRRGQSYITTPTNYTTTSALASGNGHMMAGATEPCDIRRPRSNSYSASGENSRPTMFTRPSLGGRTASSAAGTSYRSTPNIVPAPGSQERPSSSSPVLQTHPNMPLQQYPSVPHPPFSPDSERSSLSPDADDEASPEQSPLQETESSSPSPDPLIQATDGSFDHQDPENPAIVTSDFGLPEAQVGANVSFSDTGNGLQSAGHDRSIAGDAEIDPDAEGIPEALSMPRDLMPSEDAFEDEGLTTLERIFLLSRSEHAFHR